MYEKNTRIPAPQLKTITLIVINLPINTSKQSSAININIKNIKPIKIFPVADKIDLKRGDIIEYYLTLC